MKNVLHLLGGMGLLLVAGLMGCATTQPSGSMQPVGTVNRAELVGKWTGERESGKAYPVDMEISGENLQGKIVYYQTSTGTQSNPFNGVIQGDELRIEWDQAHWVRLQILKGDDGRLYLKGNYQRGKTQGVMLLKKS
jgi:hypothetical protein